MANEPIQDTSLLLDNASAEARTAQAREAQSALKSRESLSSPGSKYKGVPDEDADNALSKAFEEATGAKPDDAPEIPPAGAVTKAPGVPDAPKTPAEIEAERAAEAAKAREEGESSLDDLIKSAQEEEKVPAEAPPKEEPVEKPYAEHALPANASQKSKDSFENLRKAAAEREQAQRTRADAAEARAAEAEKLATEAKAKIGVLTPELEQELKELREHRALFAREADPAFKQKYDTRQNGHYESIYNLLKVHQLREEFITELKAMPKKQRDAEIDRLVGLLEKPEERRPFESQLLKIQTIEEERTQELADTRAKAAEVVKAEREAPKQQTQARLDEIANLVRPNLKDLGWIVVKDIPAGTPPELKKQLEGHNKFALEMQTSLRAAITDDSVQTRATAALAVPLSYYFAREARAAKAELAEVKAQLDRIKKAGATSRLAERASTKANVPVVSDVNADPRDVMDDLFKSASESAPSR